MSVNKQTQGVRTVWWEEDAYSVAVCLLDQSLLPHEVLYLRLTTEIEVANAIKTLKVRGAPAIGVTAAFGMALSLYRVLSEQEDAATLIQAQQHLREVGSILSRTRPTAVNLFWAIERMQACVDSGIKAQYPLPYLAQRMRNEAQAIADEDADACLKMGAFGAELIAEGDMLFTHCNAGALATTALRTSVAAIYVAHRAGKHFHVFV